MKRFTVTYKNKRNGKHGNRGCPVNFYAVNEQQVREHFDKQGYCVVSLRECHTLA